MIDERRLFTHFGLLLAPLRRSAVGHGTNPLPREKAAQISRQDSNNVD
jgi:hypothetical protein